ncbi:MAG: Fur family transcriptional regulator [Pseudomonadota bacterium]
MADTHTQTLVDTPCRSKNTQSLLAEARQLVEARGQKLTKVRRKVLQLLLESDEPAKAYHLMDQLDGEGSPKPPTVYRALDFLQEMGLVHKIESLNAFVACEHIHHAHAAAFLICTACGKAEELHAVGTNEAMIAESSAAGFRVQSTVIEARGICKECAA